MNDSKSISLRAAVWEDVEFLLSLRNDPVVWSHAIQARTVGRLEHFEWFKGVLQREDVRVFIILSGGVAVGQVRYDLKQDGVFLSIAIDADHRGQGFGTKALKLISQKIFSLSGVNVIKALIKENNKASLRCFETIGFCRVGREKYEKDYFIIMEFRKLLK